MSAGSLRLSTGRAGLPDLVERVRNHILKAIAYGQSVFSAATGADN